MSTIGGLLIKKSMLTAEQLVQAKNDQQQKGGPLVASLIRLGLIRDEDLLMCLHQEYRLPILDLQSIEPSPEVLRLIPSALAQKHHVLPISRNGSILTLAVADPSHLAAFNEVKFLSGCDVKVVLAQAGAIDKAIQKHYSQSAQAYEEVLAKLEAEKPSDSGIEIDEMQRASEDAPVVRLVSTLMSDAIEKRASDIHIEPYEDGLRVRFRIDGVLHEVMQPPVRLKAAIASRIKVMAALDIAERRLPQDGVIKLKASGNREINFRISVLPTVFGEKVVLRVLAKGNLQYDLDKLGMEEPALRTFKKAIAEPSGMVLVTGPTGSGKTTTLYSALAALNKEERNISSAEDPVEIYMRGINQVKISEDIGLTFAAVLRSFLRQDPDVLMVGEIRDFETIEIAVKAALTGHLVLSTLHTNDAPSTIGRMLNMGVDAFLVSSSLNLIVAQRLARVICPHCKVPIEEYPREALRDVGFREDELDTLTLYQGRGCEECSNTGYQGRLAFYEVLPMTEEMRSLVIAHSTSDEIRRRAISQGMVTLREGGLQKAREGQTTIEEVLRVTSSDTPT
ncbi:MAG: type IV-A pilus assembly ATPase PilB [Deltaproteobacteria bacterium]|nr:type IV-A pilus assembly ATPase PilB [Deltaproteobacteria bacterium]